MILSYVSRLRIAVALILAVLPLMARSATVVAGPSVKTSGTTATIEWRTDVETGTRLWYGTQPGQLTSKAEGPVTADHSVTVSALSPGRTYYFEFGTAKRPLGSGSFVCAAPGAPRGETANPTKPSAAPDPIFRKKPVTETPAQAPAPAARVTWGNLESLPDHYNRHGADFHATSPDNYAAQAWAFLQRARSSGLPMKWDDADHTLRVWEPATRTFAAYDSRGRTRTFFKPSNPDYWTRQPGRSVKPSDLPF